MSHLVTIQTEVRDAVALGAACRRLNFSPPVHETTKLFSGEVLGLAVSAAAKESRAESRKDWHR